MLICLTHSEMVVRVADATEEMQMPIQGHRQRAHAERLFAADAMGLGHAPIHIALAEMHELAAASALNESLAPFEHSRAWRTFAH